MAHPLPSFEVPPVTEVVVSSRFRPSEAYNLMSAAALAEWARDRGFPVIEERPGYEAPAEQFGAVAPTNSVSLELLSGPPPMRYWFQNASGDELLQLQPNWVAANWRKVAPTAAYGRWDSRWDAFAAWARQVEAVLGPGKPLEHEQVEVTYVNHIEGRGVWTSHGEAASVFSFLASSADLTDGFLTQPETSTCELHFIIPGDEGGDPIGRLYVTVSPAFKRPTNEPIFVMNLTARGRPTSGGLDGVRQFAEIAHEWIVRSFSDLTTERMHRAWHRIDDDQGGTT